jgi:hypothetical protein
MRASCRAAPPRRVDFSPIFSLRHYVTPCWLYAAGRAVNAPLIRRRLPIFRCLSLFSLFSSYAISFAAGFRAYFDAMLLLCWRLLSPLFSIAFAIGWLSLLIFAFAARHAADFACRRRHPIISFSLSFSCRR